ncbi:MAG TPA: signal recognition particle protein [Clostridia bacterium]|nr:signal recognition particle protein [Clostridia bacterium]
MAAFGTLSERINHVFSKLKNKGRLTDLEIKQAMREIRVALLEADVNITVVKDFINTVSEKAMGEDILKSLTPGQQVIKIVNEELISLLGGTQSKLAVSSKLPTVIMMCGLQGSGKTTMCAKLGLYLKKQGKRPLAVACDIYRPAAINQLQVVSQKADIGFFEMGQVDPVKIAKKGVEYALKNNFDTVILDTAGRLHINEELMQELVSITKAVDISEKLLVVDSMTGQDAVNVAKAFDEILNVSGVIMTKLDGDTRGGATLSIRAVTGKPVKFCGIGEKLTDLEPFYPERMASRILGMGDVLTLIEKAQQSVDMEKAAELAKKLKEATFDLNDFLTQLDSMKNMGNINDVVGMLPGASKMNLGNAEINEKEIYKNKAIIQSMTATERTNPKLLNYARRKRVAAGSGTSVQDVNKLMKQFEQTKEMMKRFGKRGAKFPF